MSLKLPVAVRGERFQKNRCPGQVGTKVLEQFSHTAVLLDAAERFGSDFKQFFA
jgi:hypothetical protein